MLRSNKNSRRKNVASFLKLNKIETIFLVFFVLIFIGVPYSIQTWQGYDDALFINHAISISTGQWLGLFNDTTLVKGPGYPLFLALCNMLFGINIAIAQSLFWALACIYLFRICSLNNITRFIFFHFLLSQCLIHEFFYWITQSGRQYILLRQSQ